MRLGFLLCPLSSVPPGEEWLSPHERERLAGMRVPKRRSDFRLGRWTGKLAVREALGGCSGGGSATGWVPSLNERSERFGRGARAERERGWAALSTIDIRAARDGAPEVFVEGLGDAGLGISLAHSGGRGLAVVGPKCAVFGADLETVEPRSPAFISDFFTAAERDRVSSAGAGLAPWAATLVWSAKEAVLKALREGLREDTRAVEISLDGTHDPHAGPCFQPIRGLAVSSGRSFRGLAALVDGQVVTVMCEGDPPKLARFNAGPGSALDGCSTGPR